MKKQYLLFIFSLLFLSISNTGFSQISGTSCFLQGRYLEIGEIGNGAFGTCTAAPTGYHPFIGTNMAMVYDYGHDGWTVGTPPQMGDYTLPGTPFEGWELQINGQRNLMYQGDFALTCPGGFAGTCAPCGTLGGSITSYTNSGGRVYSQFTGTCYTGSVVNFTQTTEVDTNASWVVVTTTFYNTSASDIPDVYYLRTTDPDNDEYYAGGSFATYNHIQYQNDAQHRVLVTATGHSGTYTRIGLGTKDPRAVCFIYGAWPISGAQDLATIYDKTWTGGYYTEGGEDDGDIAIGLVVNLCSIPAHDSSVLSYAYIFGADASAYEIDSAFPAPAVVVGDSVVTQGIVNDTFKACNYPDSTGITINLTSSATSRTWTWTSWTWTPTVGLSSSTGDIVRITFADLPGATSYTVVGLDTNYCERDTQILIFTIDPCNSAFNNSPCLGDTLKLSYIGVDTVGATYYWYGPGGYASTQRNPYIFPATFAEGGLYHLIKSVGSISDTDSTFVIIHPLPVLTPTSNSPLCQGAVDTLLLSVSPDSSGEIFTWSGPAGYTATGQFQALDGFGAANVGTYKVIGTTTYGCRDSAYTAAALIPQPAPPGITDVTPVCQGTRFIPFTVDSAAGSHVLWWPSATGGVSTTTPPVISTSLPGTYYVYASQVVGSCQSLRGHDSLRVVVTPPAPTVSGNTQYCQFVGPLDTLNVTTTATGVAKWYKLPTAGDTSAVELWPNLLVAGTYTFYVFQEDSNCYSPSTTVVTTVHPQPMPPTVTKQLYCQFADAARLVAATTEAGDTLTWFGPGISASGTLLTPTPQTDTPKLDTYYVNETSIYGCISGMSVDTVRVLPEPVAPRATDATYCQFATALPLNYQADSAGIYAGTHLNWYLNGVELAPIPVPSTQTPGDVTYYVSQTVNNCQGDSAAIKITTIFLPQFSITASSPWVCQLDSITLAYNGPALANAGYQWTLPVGDSFGAGSNANDSIILVKFDSASENAYVYLKASDDNGKCATIDTISIKVVYQPSATSYTKADVCLGDTTTLGIANKTENAANFAWYVDYFTLLGNSQALNIISANSNSGGPFMISWLDTGRHVIQLNSTTEEGCASLPSFDTVFVHTPPDASFSFKYSSSSLCLEDSVYFTANTEDYNNSFTWSPAHSFSNVNKPEAWGQLEQTQSIITLTVTDPFGCTASTSHELDPGTCCTVAFPNAFTPNGDGHNDKFRPLFTGYHNFHVFRIQNRWGQTVFESTNSNMQWDGTFSGVPQDMGVYFYYIKYDCGGQTIEESGDVTLIR